MNTQRIPTRNAPQAIRAGNTLCLSDRLGLDPATMQLVDGIEAQVHRIFRNFQAVVSAAGASMDEAVDPRVFLADLPHFPLLNEIISQYAVEPCPARSAVGVSKLPRGALVEVEAVSESG